MLDLIFFFFKKKKWFNLDKSSKSLHCLHVEPEGMSGEFPLFFMRINVLLGAVILVPSDLPLLDVLESICHGGLWSVSLRQRLACHLSFPVPYSIFRDPLLLSFMPILILTTGWGGGGAVGGTRGLLFHTALWH